MKEFYYDAPYVKEIRTKVVSVKPLSKTFLLKFDKTIIYPGGGGQARDRATVNGEKILNAFKEKDGVWYEVSKKFVVGEEVLMRIDWRRRYSLMKAHTAEHLLFRSLNKVLPELEVIKVRLEEEGFKFYVRGRIDWKGLGNAQSIANKQILNGLGVKQKIVSLEDAKNIENIRIKYDSLKKRGVKEARIIFIGDFDVAACTGVHVKNTKELGYLHINNYHSLGHNEYEISFSIGEEALNYSSESNALLHEILEELKLDENNSLMAIKNLIQERNELKQALRRLNQRIIKNIKPIKPGIYYNEFINAEQKLMQRRINEIIRNGASLIIFVNIKHEKIFITIAKSKNNSLELKPLFKELLQIIEGKGGGNEQQLFGSGTYSKEKLEELRKTIKEKINLIT